jgi:hypothetical protein
MEVKLTLELLDSWLVNLTYRELELTKAQLARCTPCEERKQIIRRVEHHTQLKHEEMMRTIEKYAKKS